MDSARAAGSACCREGMPRKRTLAIESVLDGAMELFSERGYHGTSMQAIAAHLKLSRSSVYYTFRDKSALFVQALRRYTGEERAPGLSELSGAGSPRAALVRVFEVAAGGEEEGHPGALYLLIETAKGLRHRKPELARQVDETFLDMEARFRDAIERGKAAAEIANDVDPVTVARVLISLYFGLYVIAGPGTAGKRQRAVLQQVETLLPAPRLSSTPTAGG